MKASDFLGHGTHGKACRPSGTTEPNFSVFRVFSGQKVVVLFFLILMALAPHPALAQDETVPEWAVGLKALADENGMEFPWNEWDELLKAADDLLTSDILDRDGDGLFMSTDPNDYNPDVDDDGFTDGYEISNGADPESKDSCPTLGDVNLDGLSNNLDAILIFNYTLGNIPELAAPENGEVDLDGALNNLDAIVLFNWTLSNISLIPNPALPERIHLVKKNGSGDFTTIQEAIDQATTGDTVIVYPGVYAENITFRGNDIALMSIDPFDDAIVTSTVITGRIPDDPNAWNNALISFTGAEQSTTLLMGINLKPVQMYFGIFGNGGKPTIRRNRYLNNDAVFVHGCDGVIAQNYIKDNFSEIITDCNGMIYQNLVRGTSHDHGGYSHVIGQSEAAIVSNVFLNNGFEDVGPVVSSCRGIISNCYFEGNWDIHTNRANVINFEGIIESSCFLGALVPSYVQELDGIIRNSVFWFDPNIMPFPGEDPNMLGRVDPSMVWNSCILGWAEEKQGNFYLYPELTQTVSIKSWPGAAENLWYPAENSPLIDSGQTATYAFDIHGQSRPSFHASNGSGYDIGPFEILPIKLHE